MDIRAFNRRRLGSEIALNSANDHWLTGHGDGSVRSTKNSEQCGCQLPGSSQQCRAGADGITAAVAGKRGNGAGYRRRGKSAAQWLALRAMTMITRRLPHAQTSLAYGEISLAAKDASGRGRLG